MVDNGKVVTRNTAKLKSDTESTSPSLQSIDEKLDSVLKLLGRNTNDIKEIKMEQINLATSIENCHASIVDINRTMAEQNGKIANFEGKVERANEETMKLQRKLNRVEQNVRDLEQYSHRNNLIVYGIPEEKTENILHVMRRLAEVLQFEGWSSNVMDAVHRMGKSTDSRPRPIIVRFISRLDKDLFLNKRKVVRNLKASDLGYASKNSIYVNESLTAANRELLKKTREVARNKGYSQVWTANCTIFTRRDKGAPAIKIMSTDDLDRL